MPSIDRARDGGVRIHDPAGKRANPAAWTAGRDRFDPTHGQRGG